MVQVWKDQRLVQMISTIHEARIVNTRQKDRKTKMEIKKPYAVVHYGKFMRGVDRTDQYLSFYAVLRNTVKMVEKGGTVSAKLCTLQCIIFCVQDTKYTKKKLNYKNFLHEVGRSWISEVQNQSESSSDDLNCQRSKHQGSLKRTRQEDSSGISGYTNLKKCLPVGR
jgi:hypothetical protein